MSRIVLVLFLLIMPACKRGRRIFQDDRSIWSGTAQQEYAHKNSDTTVVAQIIEKEARLDVPLPLQITPQFDYFLQTSAQTTGQSETIMVGYNTIMTPDNLIKFYDDQMECFGWKKTFSCIDTESVLIFQKPQGASERVCTIAIRPSSHSNAQTSNASSVVICAGTVSGDTKSLAD